MISRWRWVRDGWWTEKYGSIDIKYRVFNLLRVGIELPWSA